MAQKPENQVKCLAIFIISAMLAGCGPEENAPENASQEVNVPAGKTSAAKAEPRQNNDIMDRHTVDLVLDGKPQQLQNLICASMGSYTTIVATSEDESHMVKMRLKKKETSPMPESFQLFVTEDDTQIIWNASDLEIKKSSDKTYNINGIAKGSGLRLKDDGNYAGDPTLKPKHDMPFQVSFTCK